MRLSAYKKALQEASTLPAHIPELKSYFKNDYSPRDAAMWEILTIAREDVKALFPSEFIDVYNKFRALDNNKDKEEQS